MTGDGHQGIGLSGVSHSGFGSRLRVPAVVMGRVGTACRPSCIEVGTVLRTVRTAGSDSPPYLKTSSGLSQPLICLGSSPPVLGPSFGHLPPLPTGQLVNVPAC